MPLWLRRSIQLVLAGTVFGFAAATWLYVISGLQGDYLRTVAFVMPFWYLWAVYAPLVVWLSTRFPMERGLVMARCFMHLSVAALLSLVHTGARFEFQPGFRDGIGADTAGPASLEPLFALAALELPVHVFIYSAILGGTHIVRYYRRSRERELTAARLKAQLVDARMLALQMQLNPHFLFNALNSIAMLVRDAEKVAAVDALEALSDLLRYVLDDSACQEVPLKRELEFIERYLAMEKIRFRDRLEVRTEVDRKTLDAMVPNLLLQPIVENAIRHGIESRADPTTITISACKDGPALRLRVSDDGPGSHGTLARGGSGVGIRNTRRRLAQLYGEGALLVAKDAEPTGATIKMTLPFHTVPLANRDDS
jgi:signal transduction histidine kinase